MYKHGERYSRLYTIWCRMKARCYNSNNHAYNLYGGRGIVICDEWQSNYCVFKEWAINNGYKDDLTLDRIDVNGNYEPNNCRWATRKEQANNTRTNHYITYNNETHTLAEWSDITGIQRDVIKSRIEKGMNLDDVFLKEVQHSKRRYYTYNGETHNLTEWAKKMNINYSTLIKRLKKGLDIEQALTKPIQLEYQRT